MFLILSNYSLEVVEACSGIRSLMTLISLAVAYGYLAEPRRWVRYVLVVLMVPSAIVSNAIRIMGAGMMAHRFGPAAAEGFLHEFSGWVIFWVRSSALCSFATGFCGTSEKGGEKQPMLKWSRIDSFVDHRGLTALLPLCCCIPHEPWRTDRSSSAAS